MTARTSPLEGVTVIDLTRVLAGPYLTMMLADMGAEVIKVEMTAGGDDARHFGPFIEGVSAYFSTVNRGKKSIALNLKDAGDREIFEKLVVRGDILAENYRAGTLDRLGYGWDKLHSMNPGLIYAAISGFGHTGPYRDRPAYDLVVQGMGGIMSLTGDADSPPMRVGASVGDIAAGLFGLSGVLCALYDREKTGTGMKIDAAMLDCQVAILENAVARYFAEDEIPGPMGLRHPSITPFAGFKAKNDEYIIIAVGNDPMFEKFCGVLNRRDLAADPRFVTNALRTENYQALFAEIEASLAAGRVDEWLDIFDSAGIPCGPINNIEQVVTDRQVLERNMIVCAETESGLKFKMPGNPIKLSAYPDSDKRKPAPRLDQHRREILDFLEQKA